MGQHAVLAAAHVLDDLQLAEPRMTPLELGHEARQDADHAATTAEGSVGERAHGADRASTVDDAEVVLCQYHAESRSRFAIGCRGTAAGSAVDAHRGLEGAPGDQLLIGFIHDRYSSRWPIPRRTTCS